ncbi:Spore coat protein CotF [Clostridium amylolyticum]|uniref:Spore coat protein CotF n=1 Tax=Clostridium amylolyticum TaxID=1121298 RepID=A0A1M6HK58_9CLOT|nr:spore coat protein [Clostridium amylolyticum]SHJ22509.1 Spore coat protein CotF [Clostridium amylolyticum]
MAWMDSILGPNENENPENNQDNTNNTNNSSNEQITDKDIAMDMLTSSKGDIGQLTKAITESTNPQLRLTLTNQLNSAINSHFRLSDMAIKKGWYEAHTCPTELINKDLGEFQGMKLQQQSMQNSQNMQ